MVLRDSLVGGHYRILQKLGQGGFGYTYLAEDTHRFDELCVLKEFTPQVSGPAALEKAQQLFEREAGVLYQLDHPQIPKFRELLRDQGRLFLVQDYVDGPSYQNLLNTRRQYSGSFSEAEIVRLLQHILPVLQYLHGLGVIHRDISPDNLIQRNADGQPVLIDFGGVKQLVVNVRHQLGSGDPYSTVTGQCTRLGKDGYAPEEQLRSGQASPSSDLYALGVTALVLLTGKLPQELYDPQRGWSWQQDVSVNPTLAKVLNKLVAPLSDRYDHAGAVIADLNLTTPYDRSWQDPLPSQMQAISPPSPPEIAASPSTLTYSPNPTHTPAYTVPQQLYPSLRKRPGSRYSGCGGALLGLLAVLGIILGLGWWAQQHGWIANLSGGISKDITPIPGGDSNPAFSEAEQARKQALKERATELQVDRSYLVRLTDQIFYEQHPNRKGQPLTESSEDEPLRAQWDAIAANLLDLISSHLSPGARSKLGRYSPADLERWKRQVNNLFVSSRALYDLSDAKFQQLFPNRTSDVFAQKPTDQVWFALTSDRVVALESGEQLSEIRFEAGRFSQQLSEDLALGEGQIYVLKLQAGQLMRLNLQAPDQATHLSLYVPIPDEDLPYLLADSARTTWNGELEQDGYYEIVVVSRAEQPISYELTLAVDKVIDGTINKPAPPNAKY